MKTTIVFIAAFLLCGYLYGQCCPYVGPSTVFPQNPTSNENTSIILNVTTPGNGVDLGSSFFINGNTIEITACYYSGPLTVTTHFSDTVPVGQLPAGVYTVILTAYQSNSDVSCDYSSSNKDTSEFSVLPTFIESTQQSQPINFFPNPLTGNKIDFSGIVVSGRIEITDIQGKNIFSQKLSENRSGIVLPEMLPGIYVITVLDVEGYPTGRFKLIKQ